jgi:hypothetical protein
MSMSLFDAKPEGTAQPPFVDQAIQTTVLSVEDVKNIIMQEQAGTVDPIAVSIQILNSLGGNIATRTRDQRVDRGRFSHTAYAEMPQRHR